MQTVELNVLRIFVSVVLFGVFSNLDNFTLVENPVQNFCN